MGKDRKPLGKLAVVALAAVLISAMALAVDVDAARGGKGGRGGGKPGGTTSTATVSVAPNPVPYGSASITVSGTGFAPNKEIAYAVFGNCCAVRLTTDSSGSFTSTYFHGYLFYYPGSYTLEVWDNMVVVASTTFTVAAQ